MPGNCGGERYRQPQAVRKGVGNMQANRKEKHGKALLAASIVLAVFWGSSFWYRRACFKLWYGV